MTYWDVARLHLRTGLRGLRRTPGVSAAIILTLALGIGANAMMFGVVDRLLLSPPQHLADAGQLRHLYLERGNPDGLRTVSRALTYPDARDLAHLPAFTSIGLYAVSPATWTLGTGADARRVRVQQAGASLFPTLGVQAARGRFFSETDDAPGAALTAVLSDEFWTRELGRDPGVIGRVLSLNRGRYEVIGIAPAGFTGAELSAIDMWLPMRASAVVEASGSTDPLEDRGQWWTSAVARLKPGASEEEADAQLTTAHLAARRAYEEAGGKPYLAYQRQTPPRLFTGSVIAARGPRPSTMSAISVWLAAVSGVVLLIACANVANLLLARALRAKRDIAIRVALGAGRGRLIGQQLTEAGLLAGAGALAAFALAWSSSAVVHTLLVPDVAFTDTGMRGRLLLFTLAAAGLTTVMAGLLPALQASRAAAADVLRASGRGNAAARSTLRGALTVAQITLSVVLLVGAGLFVRSLWGATRTNVGFDYRQTINVGIEDNTDLEQRTARRQRRRQLFREALARVSALPGVQAAALSGATIPLAGLDGFGPEELRVPGLDALPKLPGGGPYKYSGTEAFFRVLGLTVTRGRAFAPGEFQTGAEPVAMVNETFARTVWRDRDPLTQCLVYNDPDKKGEAGPCRRIVGIFADIARRGLSERPALQVAYPTMPDTFIKGLVVRAEGDPAALVPSIRDAVAAVSTDVRFVDVAPAAIRFERLLGPWRVGSAMFAAFGLLALVVAIVGLYSILAFSVAEQRRELGIRAALGASRGALVRLVLSHAARLIGTGVLLGTIGALVAGRYLDELLFNVRATDPTVYATVLLAMLAAGALAGFAPAWRAASADPAVAMDSK